MSTRNLIEKPTSMIVSTIKTNIQQALADVSLARGNYEVSTEIPSTESYFIYEGAINYDPPGIFVVPQSVASMLDRGENYIDSQAKFIVSAIVQDKEKDLLSKKAWRYQDALHNILHLTEVVDSTTNPHTKIKIKVVNQRFSNDFTTGNEQQKFFSKEVAFDCDVEIWQGL